MKKNKEKGTAADVTGRREKGRWAFHVNKRVPNRNTSVPGRYHFRKEGEH